MKARNRTWSYYHLRKALALPDCALCRLGRKTARQYLDSLLWESVNDEGLRPAEPASATAALSGALPGSS